MISEDVLIIGGGLAGLSAAAALSGSGIASTVIDTANELGGKLLGLDSVHQTEETRLVQIQGAAGEFNCRLQTGGSTDSKQFGAVVAATGSSVITPEGFLPLSKLRDVPARAGSVCIIMAPGSASGTVQAQAALGGALALRNGGSEVTVLYQQMSVAGTGLQGLYDEARAAGVVFGRYAKYPSVNAADGAHDVEFTADDLAERVRLHCDAVLAEGGERPSPGAAELAELLDLGTDGAGFFQTENVSLYPVGTRRRGIFAVGSCRKPSLPDEVASDACCAAGQIRELFATLREGPPVEAPVVDTEKCAFCLTCMRACPHRAIGFDFENRAARILQNACYACGTCVGECPARAIKFEAPAQKQDAPAAGIAGFFCRRSAAQSLGKLRENGLSVPEMEVTEVECSGTVEIPEILDAFEKGAAGVIIGGCHKGSCRSLTGSHYAGKRSERIKAILKQAGIEPERLRMLFISDIEPVELSQALCEFAESLEGARKGEQ